MNSRALRRLAADQGALRSQPLPPNYLFPPGAAEADDLTQLDVLLAGPTHTPFAAGVWKLHLTTPPTYPQQPPTANFRTPIFHPNVHPQTGGVCVETLKRDWQSNLTLRDVLVTISCLLIQPNPDSALNAEAGGLIQEDYDAFARRAKTMTAIQAVVPKALQAAVQEAQNRGQEQPEDFDGLMEGSAAPARKRRAIGRLRGVRGERESDGSPSDQTAGGRQQVAPSHAFVMETAHDDVFGMSLPPSHEHGHPVGDLDSSMNDADQENDESRSPTKIHTPKLVAPRRPRGAATPLGELRVEDVSSDSDDQEMEPEYPPSPTKSPSKSPSKRRQQHRPFEDNVDRPESSRDAARRAPNITPPNILFKPLAADSPFAAAAGETPSPRKNRVRQLEPHAVRAPLFRPLSTTSTSNGVVKTKSPSSAEKKAREQKRREELNEKLWQLCGQDIQRWNRGDFDGEPFIKKAKRW